MFPQPDPSRMIKTLRSREVYANRYVTLFDDDVEFPDGGTGRYLRLVAGGGRPAAAALVTCDDLVALVLTYRYPIGQWEWGIPRGLANAEDSRSTILTELREELGGQPVTLEHLGTVHPDSGLLASHVDIYHARWLTPIAEPTDANEVHDVLWISFQDLDRAIADGAITDNFTLVALTLARVRGVVRFNA